MTRNYLRLDPMIFERKAVEQHYSAAELGTFVATLALGEHQPHRGRFRSTHALRAQLDDPDRGVTGYGRHVKTLLERGDLVEQPDGRLYIDGWDEWQEGDFTVRDRVARLRDRRKGTASNVTDPGDVTAASVTSRQRSPHGGRQGDSNGRGVSEAIAGAVGGSDRLLEINAAWSGRLTPSQAFVAQLNRWCERFGEAEFTAAVERHFAADVTADPFRAAVDELVVTERRHPRPKTNGAARPRRTSYDAGVERDDA